MLTLFPNLHSRALRHLRRALVLATMATPLASACNSTPQATSPAEPPPRSESETVQEASAPTVPAAGDGSAAAPVAAPVLAPMPAPVMPAAGALERAATLSGLMLQTLPDDFDRAFVLNLGWIQPVFDSWLPVDAAQRQQWTEDALRSMVQRAAPDLPALPQDRFRLLDGTAMGVVQTADGQLLVLDVLAVVSPPADGARPVRLGDGASMIRRLDLVYAGPEELLNQADRRQAAAAGNVPHPRLGRISMAPAMEPGRLQLALVTGLVRCGPADPWLHWCEGRDVLLQLNHEAAWSMTMDGDAGTLMEQALGRSQRWANAAVGAMQRQWPAEAQPIGAWLNRLTQSTWELVQLQIDDQLAILSAPAPRCPGAHRALVHLSVLVGLLQASSHDDAIEGATFVPTTGLLAEGCPEMPLTGGIGTRLARVAPEPDSQPAAMMLFDGAAITSSILPTLMGLWPAALNERTLNEAAGDRPLGMQSWSDPDADGVIYLEPLARRRTVVLYPGGRTLLEGPASDAARRLVTLSNGLVASTDDVAGVELRLNQSTTPSTWERWAGRASDSTIALVLVTPSLLTPVVMSLPSGSVASSVLQSGPLIGLALDRNQGLEFWLAAQGTVDQSGEQLRTATVDVLATAARLDTVQRGELDELVSMMSLTTADGVGRLHWQRDGWSSSFRMLMLVGAPILGAALPGESLQGIRDRMSTSPIQLPPGMVAPRLTPPDPE